MTKARKIMMMMTSIMMRMKDEGNEDRREGNAAYVGGDTQRCFSMD